MSDYKIPESAYIDKVQWLVKCYGAILRRQYYTIPDTDVDYGLLISTKVAVHTEIRTLMNEYIHFRSHDLHKAKCSALGFYGKSRRTDDNSKVTCPECLGLGYIYG